MPAIAFGERLVCDFLLVHLIRGGEAARLVARPATSRYCDCVQSRRPSDDQNIKREPQVIDGCLHDLSPHRDTKLAEQT
jgi:hypothetical protein